MQSNFLVACVETFDVKQNFNALGASRAPSAINSANECETYCRNLPYTNCVGFDFNKAANECWIHSNVDDMLESNQRPNNDVDLYIRVQQGSCGKKKSFRGTMPFIRFPQATKFRTSSSGLDLSKNNSRHSTLNESD